MKKDVGMTTAQKSKETRRMEMGSIFFLYIQPHIRMVLAMYRVHSSMCTQGQMKEE